MIQKIQQSLRKNSIYKINDLNTYLIRNFSTIKYKISKLNEQERQEKLMPLITSHQWKIGFDPEYTLSNKQHISLHKKNKKQIECIEKTFLFQDFNESWSFMSRVALIAEKINHHPEWFNVYNKVHVILTTHDCHGISLNDIQMAHAMDKYAILLKK